MKIAVFNPKNDFTPKQQEQIGKLGEVVWAESREALPTDKLVEMAKNADIIAVDPDPLGGFEKAKDQLTKMMESVSNLKGLCLSTTSFGWVDLDYCKKRNLPVSNVPGYSSESVAEHTLALLLCLAKRIIVSDRKTIKGEYKLEMGFELRGKTLGIIGLGNIGSKAAALALGIGMKVIAYNRTPTTMEGVEMKSLDEVLTESDAISLHTTHEEANNQMISKKELAKMKDGVIIVNTVDRELVDENAMAEAVKSGKVYGYAYEGEDLINTPLAGIENVVGIKGFAWYTKEALANLYEIWTGNILALAEGKPRNRVA